MSANGKHWHWHGKSTEERFLSHIDPNASTGCWNWNIGLDKDGYGKFKVDGKTKRAHIWSYEHFVAPVPKGHELHHTCENKRCANYNHVVPATSKRHICELSPAAPAFKNLRKQTCPAGHPLAEGNLTPHSKGRDCLACRRRRSADYKHRKRRSAGIPERGRYKYV